MPRPRKPDQQRVNPRLSSKARDQLAALGRWLYPERSNTAALVIEEALDDLYARIGRYRFAYAANVCPQCAQYLAPSEVVERPQGVYWCGRCRGHLEGYYPDQPPAFYAAEPPEVAQEATPEEETEGGTLDHAS